MISISDKDNDYQGVGNRNGYVVVCRHIAEKTRPVLMIEMNPPYDKDHSGWEAICNTEGDDCDVEDYVQLPMKDFLEYEPSLIELIKNPKDLPQISRESKDSPWRIIP